MLGTGNGNGHKRMEIHSELCFWALYKQSTQTIACVPNHTSYIPIGTLETKAPLQCPGQLRPHQHTHNTHLGTAPHVVSHHVDKEPMLVGGDLNR